VRERGENGQEASSWGAGRFRKKTIRKTSEKSKYDQAIGKKASIKSQ